jgi:hypothetical protein
MIEQPSLSPPPSSSNGESAQRDADECQSEELGPLNNEEWAFATYLALLIVIRQTNWFSNVGVVSAW